jgi:hypothetical protein
VLADPQVVADFRQAVAAHPDADVIMCQSTIAGRTYPLTWGATPAMGYVTLANWFVRRAVFCSVPYGGRYEGDADHIVACWQRGYHFAWWQRVVCTAQGWSQGRPEVAA